MIDRRQPSQHKRPSCSSLGVCQSRQANCAACDEADLGPDFSSSPWDWIDRVVRTGVLLIAATAVVAVVAALIRAFRG